MQVWTMVCGNTAAIASGKPLRPSTTAIRTPPTPRVLSSFPEPELGALGLLDPQAEHLLFALAVEGQCDIDGLVAHQPLVADLDPQRVEENHRIHRIERPALPLAYLLEYSVGDPADQIGGNLDRIQLQKMRLNLAHRQAAGVQADDPIIKTLKPGLPLGDDLGLEAAVSVPRHRDLDRAVIADYRLARRAVARVAAAAARRVALLVAQMLAQLGAKRALQKALLEFLEQPLLAQQILR